MKSEILTVGDLLPEDDLMHGVGAEGNHNESMFFNFFDTRQGFGGFVRIGNRVNEQHAEMTLCLFLPGGEIAMQWAKPKIDSNAAFDAAGMKFWVVEPARRLGVSYHGAAVRIRNPDEMANPGVAMRGNPQCEVHLELQVSANGPMIGDRNGRPGSVIFLDGVGHYQQPIASAGEISVGSDRWRLLGNGVRDHSWGPRNWQSIYRDRSLWLSFGDDLTVIACKTWLSRDCKPDEMGCVIEHGRVKRLRSIAMRTHFRPDTFYHDAVDLEVVDSDDRKLAFEGKVLTYVPLRHRKAGLETVFLGQAMTEFTLGDRRTIGLSEYFDAESATGVLVELSRKGASENE